jgi:hypothetical protein
MAAIFHDTEGSYPNICRMKAFTVSSDGRRVLKVGTGGRASFDFGAAFCCATLNETIITTSEQQSNERRMSSFRNLRTLEIGVETISAHLGGDWKAAA